ncbi:MAG TPA: biopolymer transporter ExbD [Myxococcota bacterium]|nr:biopolymer transporter ExbD [Myxococcota bacterium]
MGILSNNHEGEGGSLFVDINVTPLVDVMLVLLIIFMVTAPFMMETIGVNLPKGEGQAAQNTTDPLTISIDKNERITIAKQSFTLEELKEFLRDSPRIKRGEPVFIEADQEARHRVLAGVMSSASAAGASKLNIIVEKP